jgi:hypothetical protein
MPSPWSKYFVRSECVAFKVLFQMVMKYIHKAVYKLMYIYRFPFFTFFLNELNFLKLVFIIFLPRFSYLTSIKSVLVLSSRKAYKIKPSYRTERKAVQQKYISNCNLILNCSIPTSFYVCLMVCSMERLAQNDLCNLEERWKDKLNPRGGVITWRWGTRLSESCMLTVYVDCRCIFWKIYDCMIKFLENGWKGEKNSSGSECTKEWGVVKEKDITV